MTTQTELEKQLKAMNEKLDEIKSAVGWLTAIVMTCFIFTAFMMVTLHSHH